MSALARLARYLRPHAARAAWAAAAMCAVALFNGTAVLLLKPIVDRIFIAKDTRMLWLAVVALPLLLGLKAAASYLQNYMTSWLGQKIIQSLRADLFRHLHELPLDYFESHGSGEILSRATGDLILLQSAMNSVPVYLIRDSMTLVALLASLFYLDKPFAWLSLTALPLVAAALFILSRKMRDASRQSQLMLGRITQSFQESVRDMPRIRQTRGEHGVLSRFNRENDSFLAPTMIYLRATALAAPLMELCAGVVAAFLLYLGGREVIEGHMTPGAFSAFLGAYVAAYAPIKNLARSNSELQRALASAERVFQLLDEPVDPALEAVAAP